MKPDTASDTSQPAQVSDDRLRGLLGYRLRRASNAVQADLAETLKPFDLRMITYTALVLVVDNPGLSQSQLAAAMDVERPNLVVIVDELERRELITRDRVPTDRRTYALNATLAGRRLCDQAESAVRQHEARIFGTLLEEERSLLARGLLHVIAQRTGES
ncbi:MarR family transcriptional regulator [Mesobacterium sp. TK19101]|uniref:MarR family transcriptional regulator n=1 Tax=Mesobacterium hydrothermale TaxID=3111907 RepID=A0ABU6HGD8_9RHOB|nr:MarR family transcriptional regulator [Mesobacterium sp. TK19101]MEC3860528.1 MarR family transcriptional regulator [Mesobacterium sp. TK19101]